MNLHYLQHVPFEDLASIEPWAHAHHHSISVTRLFQNEPWPDLDTIDFLVVLGGPMNVDQEDRFSWLADEKRFIESAIQKEKIVWGICLGSQLIASVLGAQVFPNQYQEIGWFPVELTEEAPQTDLFASLPKRFSGFHWHGDTFDLPHGAIHLARSEACNHQAFLYGDRVLGLQFHLESTFESVQRMLQHEIEDLTEGPYIQKPEEILSRKDDFHETRVIMHTLLDRIVHENPATCLC